MPILLFIYLEKVPQAVIIWPFAAVMSCLPNAVGGLRGVGMLLGHK
jgi:hypothetical protein